MTLLNQVLLAALAAVLIGALAQYVETLMPFAAAAASLTH